MSKIPASVLGKTFVHSGTKDIYGPIREPSQTRFSTLSGSSFEVLGEDSCGNYFAATIDGAVLFWDHETDHLTHLANSVSEFVDHCVESPPIELDPKQVKSVWIDPEFARSIGKKVPPDGWVKKRS